jgi:hypothetical protein
VTVEPVIDPSAAMVRRKAQSVLVFEVVGQVAA